METYVSTSDFVEPSRAFFQMFAGIPISIKHTKYSDIKHDAAPDAMSKLDRDFGSKKKKSRCFLFIRPCMKV